MSRVQAAAHAKLAVVDVARELAALESMTVAQLAQRYQELYGEPTRSRNRAYLRKRLAWRVQELAEGGLSSAALRRISELGDELPERWRMRLTPSVPTGTLAPASPPRDERLPAPGTVLQREFGGELHQVVVREAGFEYRGREFRSLSAVAKAITGTAWNGYSFFQVGTQKTLAGRKNTARRAAGG